MSVQVNYLKVVNCVNLLKTVYMFDQESFIKYFGPETEYYQSLLKDDLSFDPSAIGPFYQNKQGNLYSTEHNAFMCWNEEVFETLFKSTSDIISELELKCFTENDEDYIDPRNTKFTPEMIEKALQCGAVVQTRIPTLSV